MFCQKKIRRGCVFCCCVIFVFFVVVFLQFLVCGALNAWTYDFINCKTVYKHIYYPRGCLFEVSFQGYNEYGADVPQCGRRQMEGVIRGCRSWCIKLVTRKGQSAVPSQCLDTAICLDARLNPLLREIALSEIVHQRTWHLYSLLAAPGLLVHAFLMRLEGPHRHLLAGYSMLLPCAVKLDGQKLIFHCSLLESVWYMCIEQRAMFCGFNQSAIHPFASLKWI